MLNNKNNFRKLPGISQRVLKAPSLVDKLEFLEKSIGSKKIPKNRQNYPEWLK